MRYAVYLTPPQGSPLEEAARTWLGRSAYDGSTVDPQAPPEARAGVPGRYGFHATMRAPFRPAAEAEAAMEPMFRSLANELPPPSVRLRVASLGSFVALTAVEEEELCRAAVRVLELTEPLRAPLSEDERARRRPETLDARALELLDAWGYPHVMERFQFHMTLSGPIDASAIDVVQAAARSHFGDLLERAHELRYALFVEDEPGGPFRIIRCQAGGEGGA